MGVNMKIVEEYAQRKVDEFKIGVINKMEMSGLFSHEKIAEIVGVSLDFVEKVLSK